MKENENKTTEQNEGEIDNINHIDPLLFRRNRQSTYQYQQSNS